MPYLLGGGGMEVQMKLGGNTGTPLWWAARRVCDRTADRTTTSAATSAQKAGALELATRLVQQAGAYTRPLFSST